MITAEPVLDLRHIELPLRSKLPYALKKSFVIMLAAAQVITYSCSQSSKESSTTDARDYSEMLSTELTTFGKTYAEAWCSQKPENVASFFATNGSLTVNNGTPAIGRQAIAKVAEGFMTAFPDMVVTMDSLAATGQGLEFHWTLTGTNLGPNGTGKKVKVSGVEHWQLDDDRLIAVSMGSFDADEYNRQLNFGVDK